MYRPAPSEGIAHHLGDAELDLLSKMVASYQRSVQAQEAQTRALVEMTKSLEKVLADYSELIPELKRTFQKCIPDEE